MTRPPCCYLSCLRFPSFPLSSSDNLVIAPSMETGVFVPAQDTIPIFQFIFRIIKSTRCANFSILFWNKTLHVSDSSSVHHQEYFTVHTAMLYVILVCGQLASRIRMELSSILILLASCPQTGMTYNIAVCIVKYS